MTKTQPPNLDQIYEVELTLPDGRVIWTGAFPAHTCFSPSHALREAMRNLPDEIIVGFTATVKVLPQ